MRAQVKMLASVVAAVVMAIPVASWAQNAALEAVARTLGAPAVKSLEITGSGVSFAVGQNVTPGMPWPRFNVKDYVWTVNYETAASREQFVRSRAEQPPRGGGLPAIGEVRQNLFLGGDHAWNVMGENAVPAPIGLAERQFQLWATPHGVVKGALAHGGTVQGRTISFAVPGRFRLQATVDAQNLVQRVEGVIPHPVLGDLPIEVTYSDYRDFGGVKFPMKTTQTAGGFPSLELTVTDVRVNAPADIPVPEPVRQATAPYARVASQPAAEGVWYVTGGSHHSVVIEMKDHVVVVEAPLNDQRALAVVAEARKLVPGKAIRYVVTSHHHFDHTGGIRAFAAEGITVVTHEANRAFFERTLAAPATIAPDHLAKSGRKATVEGMRDKRVLTDGTRTVEIHHITGNAHADGMLMVYLPREKLLIQADVFTPPAPNAPPPPAVNPNTVHFADSITRLGLAVDQHLPLHGRMVPFGDLGKAIGRGN